MARVLDSFARNRQRMPRRFIAVDIDSRILRIVCAERTGRHVRVTRLIRADFPPDLEVTDARAVGGFLAKTLQEANVDARAMVMSVPRGQAVLKPLRLPPGTDEADLPDMVRYQVERELPFRIEEAVVDFTIGRHYHVDDSPETDGRVVDVLVAAVRLPVLEHYRQIATTAGVKLLRLGLRPNANLCCVLRCLGRENPGPMALVYIASDETEIDVLAGGSMEFSRAALIPVPPPGRAPAETDRAAEVVAMDVVRSLQTYQAAEQSAEIERVVLAGGTGIEPRVAKAVAGRLGVPCERLDPSEALQLADDGSASGFVSALGLAIGPDARAAGAMPFDFLNPTRPRGRGDRKKRRRLLAGGAVAVLLAAVVAGRAAHLGAKEAVVQQLQAKLRDLHKGEKEMRDLRSRLNLLEGWEQQDRNWTGHWAYLSSVLPPCTDIYVTSVKSTSMDVQRRATPGEGKPGTRPKRRRKNVSVPALSLTVRARQDEAIAELGRRLRRHGYRFKIGRVATSNDRRGYIYGTTVLVEVDRDKALDFASAPAPRRPADDVWENRRRAE